MCMNVLEKKLWWQKNKASNARNIFKPKAVVEHEKREEGLQSAISSDNKGFALLAKMGYKPGMGIGKKGTYVWTRGKHDSDTIFLRLF